MTEDQIRALCLSDKRERALLAVRMSGIHVRDKFWILVSRLQWGMAAAELLAGDNDKDSQFYADAIWEG